MKYIPLGNPSDSYGQSESQIEVMVEGEAYIHMHADRTGVLPPGYPDHPVYRLVDIDRPIDGLWVLVAGELHPAAVVLAAMRLACAAEHLDAAAALLKDAREGR